MAPSFAQALGFWHRLGWISFGGPAGQIAIMHAELVERRGWIGEAAFLRALNFCMLLPGPEAMQLATWLGWRLHGVRGGLAAGALFVLPASVLIALLAWMYLHFGELPVVAGALFGVQAAVLGILLHALQRLSARVLRDGWDWALALAALAALGLARAPFPLVIAAAALAGLVLQRWRRERAPPTAHAPAGVAASGDPDAGRSVPRPRLRAALALATLLLAAWWLPLLAIGAWLGSDSTAYEQGVFFSRAALLTFGGAYAVLPYVAQQAVEVHAWLDAGQMLVGLGLAESTPGPLVMVLEFVGFIGGWQQPDLASPLASALLCAAVTLWATFLPSFLFVLPLAPWIDAIGAQPRLQAALSAVTAAVVGVIAKLALWFGWHLLAPQAAPAAAFATAVALLVWWGLQRWRWRVAWVVSGAALAGAAAQALGASGLAA